MLRLNYKQVLSLALAGYSILTAGCAGGAPADSIGISAVRQKVVTISQSLVFPYHEFGKNNYVLVLSNQGDNPVQFKDGQLNYSSSSRNETLQQLVDTNKCPEIAAQSNCLLPIKLPELAQDTQQGYFDFKLEYQDINSKQTYLVSKLVNFRSDLSTESGVTYANDTESMIENSEQFIVAFPFRLEQDFKSIQVEVDGKNSDYNYIHCDKAEYQSDNSCTAIVKLTNQQTSPRLSLRAISNDASEQIHQVYLSANFNEFAHLTYVNSPLYFPLDADTATSNVTNTGTALAKGLQFGSINSSSDFSLDSNSTCLRLNSNQLAAGDSCDLTYKKKSTAVNSTSSVTQKISYSNGNSGARPIEDTFMIYRTLANYIKVEQAAVPTIASRGSFAINLSLVGSVGSLVSASVISANNPFNHNSATITITPASVASGTGCNLSNVNRTCTITIAPSTTGTEAIPTLPEYQAGIVELSSTTVPLSQRYVYYKMLGWKPTTNLLAERPGAGQVGVTWNINGDTAVTVPYRFTVGTGAEANCIIDNATGLMWPKNGNLLGFQQWINGLSVVSRMNTAPGAAGYNLCGHRDWHLPTVNELMSLVNYSQSSAAAFLNLRGFNDVQANYYWSSTRYAPDNGNTWSVYFSSGTLTAYNKFNLGYIWPVRRAQ